VAHAEGSNRPGGTAAPEPADRLEQALNRIAFALDRGHEAAPGQGRGPGRGSVPEQTADLHALAANIDILIARIRDVIGPDHDDAGHDNEDR
jgi:hypothetical protein